MTKLLNFPRTALAVAIPLLFATGCNKESAINQPAANVESTNNAFGKRYVGVDIGTTPKDTLNLINQRQQGNISFEQVIPPEQRKNKVLSHGSTGITLDGSVIPGSGYQKLISAGDPVGDNKFGDIVNSAGDALFISNYIEFTSLTTVDDRLFSLTQFESIPGGMYLMELNQDPESGSLSPISAKPLDFSAVNGGYNHCAAMVSPWNTHIASEEYEPDMLARNPDTGEIDSWYNPIDQYHTDLSLPEINPYWYGWAVEVAIGIDGATEQATSTIEKHYALGRMSKEIAYVMPDQKTVYITDDGTNGGLFLFVADEPADLSSGNLYAMHWNQTSSGSADDAGIGAAKLEWLSMGHSSNSQVSSLLSGENATAFSDMFSYQEPVEGQCAEGYKSINHKGTQECLKLNVGADLAASRLESRRYAAYIGATVEMRKEEGFTYNPHNHKAYMALAEINKGMLKHDKNDVGGGNHVNVDLNDCGGVYELSFGVNEDMGSEYIATSIKGVLSGKPIEKDGRTQCDIDGVAGPDNVAYIGYDTLLITEDTDLHENNFVWAYDLKDDELTRIFSAPLGAENTGVYMFNDVNGFSYITNAVQHPAGEKASPSKGNEAEIGYWVIPTK